MSMALAFAQGLVGGFMKNRQEKKAEIETQQSKLDDFTKILTQGMITAKANGKPFPTELGEKLKNAKAGMKNQEPMDIFGRGKVNKFELDLSKMSNIMGDVVSDDNNLVFGKAKIFKIPLAPSASTYNTDKTVRKSLFTSNYFFLNSVMPYLSTQKGRDSLTNAAKLDPTILTDIKNRYREAKSGIIEGHYGNQRAAGVLEENLKTFDFNRYVDG